MSEAQAARPLPDFVDLDFARRLEMAETITPDCVEGLRRFDSTQPIAAETIAGGVAFFGGLTYPANQMVGMGLYGEVTGDDVDRVEQFFRSRGVPSTIVVSPLADLSLVTLLGQRGYRIAEFNSVLIRNIGADETFAPPADVVIERVTPETARPWSAPLRAASPSTVRCRKKSSVVSPHCRGRRHFWRASTARSSEDAGGE